MYEGMACPFEQHAAGSTCGVALTLLAQATALVFTFAYASVRAALLIPEALLRTALWRLAGCPASPGATFYEGEVFHARKRPRENTFRRAGIQRGGGAAAAQRCSVLVVRPARARAGPDAWSVRPQPGSPPALP